MRNAYLVGLCRACLAAAIVSVVPFATPAAAQTPQPTEPTPAAADTPTLEPLVAEEPDSDGPRNPNPLANLDLETLEATRTQPLFTPSRSAPAEEVPDVVEEVPEVVEEEPEPEAAPPALQLVGVMMSGSEEVAVLLDPDTNTVHRLRPGDGYEGWSMKIVDTRSVEFSHEDRTHALTMFEAFPELEDDDFDDWDYDEDD